MGILGAIGTAAGAYFGGPAGAAIGGAIGGGLDSSMAQQQTNRDNSYQAALNRQFQWDMSSTAYQRAVNDMRAAGLNPVLAYSQGGASTGSGSVAVMQNPETASAQSAAQYASVGQQVSSSDLNTASAGESRARTVLAQKTADKTVQEITNLQTDNDKSRAMIDNLRAEYQNLVKQGWNLTEIGNQLRMSVDLMQLQSDQIVKLMQVTDWDIKLRQYQAELANLDVNAATDTNNLGREAQQFKPLFDLLRAVLQVRNGH